MLDPPRIITEYHERGSLYQVIKRTRSEERDVRERARRDLDWGNRCVLNGLMSAGRLEVRPVTQVFSSLDLELLDLELLEISD